MQRGEQILCRIHPRAHGGRNVEAQPLANRRLFVTRSSPSSERRYSAASARSCARRLVRIASTFFLASPKSMRVLSL